MSGGEFGLGLNVRWLREIICEPNRRVGDVAKCEKSQKVGVQKGRFSMQKRAVLRSFCAIDCGARGTEHIIIFFDALKSSKVPVDKGLGAYYEIDFARGKKGGFHDLTYANLY